MLATLLLREADRPDAPDSLRAIATWLPRAVRRALSADDLARIDAYAGDGEALHDMLPAVLPLSAPVWLEASITAQRGTRMVLGYGATPAGPGEIDVWFAATDLSASRIVGPLGPMRLDSQACADGPGNNELRAAAGIVIRALLLGGRLSG